MSLRYKLLETFWLFWAFNHRGIHNCILGPTLLDLQLLLQKDLGALSYMFFASGLGSMLGSGAAGFLIPRFDLRLQLFLTLVVGCVAIVAIPQVHNLAYMYFMVFVFGLTRGLVVCFVMQIAGQLWERKGPPFHFVACGTSVGAILSPVIAKPFLCPFQTLSPGSAFTNASSFDMPNNVTTLVVKYDQMEVSTFCTASDTKVQWAFFFLGCYMMPACLAQFYYWLSYRTQRMEAESKLNDYVELKHEEKLNLSPMFVLFFFTLFIMYVLLSSLPATYSAILTVYGVKGTLKMSKDDMVMMTSLFWFGSLLSRLCNALYTRHFTNFQVLLVHLIGLAVSGVLFLSIGHLYSVALWITTFCVGYFAAPYLAGVLAWVTDFLVLHPKITSLCFLASGAGNMLFPFLAGLLFNYFGAMSFTYLIFTIVVCMCMVFGLLEFISTVLPLTTKPEYETHQQ